MRRRGGCAPTSFLVGRRSAHPPSEASDAPVEVNRRDASVKVKLPDASVGVNRRDAWVKVKRPDASRRGPLAAGAKTQPVKIICTCGTSYRAFLKSLTFQECPVGYLICLRLCVLQATSHRTSVSLRGPLPRGAPTRRGPLPRGPPTRRGPLAAGAGRASPAAPRGTSAAAAVEGAAATRVGWRRWRWRGGRERVEIGSSDGAATALGAYNPCNEGCYSISGCNNLEGVVTRGVVTQRVVTNKVVMGVVAL